MKVMVLNCGSSSAKYLVYDWEKKEIMTKGIVERVTIGESFCVHEVPGRDAVKIEHDCPTHTEAVHLILNLLVSPEHGVLKSVKEIDAVGHRVVHGGEKFAKSVKIDAEALNTFKELQALAPLHNPPNILGIEAAQSMLPDVTHVAVMDTAWHQTMLSPQYMYAVPYAWYEKYRARRYGFHGTSLLYVAKRAAVLLGKDPFDVNLVTLHIGNGVSANAVKKGLSFDTSMGFTPLEGLVMGTRAGDHDAAMDFYMMQKENISPKDMDSMLNKKSGLLGITGQYTDRRDVLEAMEKGDARAKLGFEMECYRIKKYIGSYAAALGGIDAIVWTAGVGEMAADHRAKALEGLEYMGVKIDPEKNFLARTRNSESDISAPDSKVKIFVIPTDEELIMVEDTIALLNGTYDVHTNFRYSFQDPAYRNKQRDDEFQKQLQKKPEMAKAVARVPGQ
ncbi:MAG: acetate kinase [Thermacetogeniaceae bacterium]|jgi:acetate kinase